MDEDDVQLMNADGIKACAGGHGIREEVEAPMNQMELMGRRG